VRAISPTKVNSLTFHVNTFINEIPTFAPNNHPSLITSGSYSAGTVNTNLTDEIVFPDLQEAVLVCSLYCVAPQPEIAADGSNRIIVAETTHALCDPLPSINTTLQKGNSLQFRRVGRPKHPIEKCLLNRLVGGFAASTL
jgi:hypothetical protein